MTEASASNKQDKDSNPYLLSLNGIGTKVTYEEAVSFIIHCSASPQAKMKLAYLWGTQSSQGCVALQLIRFLEEELNEDVVTGKKKFEIDGWLLENQDEDEIVSELGKYSFLLNSQDV